MHRAACCKNLIHETASRRDPDGEKEEKLEKRIQSTFYILSYDAKRARDSVLHDRRARERGTSQ